MSIQMFQNFYFFTFQRKSLLRNHFPSSQRRNRHRPPLHHPLHSMSHYQRSHVAPHSIYQRPPNGRQRLRRNRLSRNRKWNDEIFGRRFEHRRRRRRFFWPTGSKSRKWSVDTPSASDIPVDVTLWMREIFWNEIWKPHTDLDQI